MTTWCFDIDGVICDTEGTDYAHAVPRQWVVDGINALKQKGDEVLLYTARGAKSGFDWRALTEQQLMEWGVNYDKLLMNKPAADFYVDDKALAFRDWRNRTQ